MEIKSIKNQQKEAFIQNLEKSFTEGVYADTPQNRKLGRVGMTYKQAKEMEKKKQEKKSLNKEKSSFAEKFGKFCEDVDKDVNELYKDLGVDENKRDSNLTGLAKALSRGILTPGATAGAVVTNLADRVGLLDKAVDAIVNIQEKFKNIKDSTKEKLFNLSNKIKSFKNELMGNIKGKNKTTPSNTGYGRRVPAPSQAKTAKDYMHSLIELSRRNDFNSKGRKILGEIESPKGEKITTFDIMGFSSKDGERFTLGMGEDNKFYKVGIGRSKNIEKIDKKELSKILSSKEGTENMSNLSEELGIDIDDTALNFSTKNLKEKINPFQ